MKQFEKIIQELVEASGNAVVYEEPMHSKQQLALFEEKYQLKTSDIVKMKPALKEAFFNVEPSITVCGKEIPVSEGLQWIEEAETYDFFK